VSIFVVVVDLTKTDLFLSNAIFVFVVVVGKNTTKVSLYEQCSPQLKSWRRR